MTVSTPVPGWYHDPADARLVRWWDGSAWTEHVQDASVVSAPATDAVATVAPGPEVAPVAPGAEVATPEGFLLPDPQATPGRRVDPPGMQRSALETAPPPQLPSRRERRQLESAASAQSGESGAASSSAESSPSLSSAESGASATVAPSAASTPSAESTSTPAIGSTVVPQPSQPMVDLRIPPLEAFSDPGIGAFAEMEPPLPESSAATTAEPAPTAARATLPNDPISPDTSDDGFARPWVSVSGGAVRLSAVELASVDYEPLPQGVLAPPRTLPPPPSRAATVSAWMLALSPLVAVVVLVAALVGAATLAGASLGLSAAPLSAILSDTVSLAIVGGALVAIPVLLIVWVVSDRRALARFGFANRASGWWILLGPFFYLVARAVSTRREGRRNASPVWVYLLTLLAVGGLLTAAPFLAPREATASEMRSVEQSISSDLQAQDLDLAIACPSSSDARLGATFVCDALTADDAVVGAVTVRWTGVDGSIQYSVELGDLPIDAID